MNICYFFATINHHRFDCFTEMKKISAVMKSVVAPCSRILSLYFVLKESWNEIVGNELFNLTSFNSARYVGNNELLITINVLNSAILLVKCDSENISNNLKRLTGAQNVKIIFQHKHFIEQKVVEANCQQQLATNRQQSVIEEKFENVLLKTALETLKAEMQDAA
jgi:hypothetical protein